MSERIFFTWITVKNGKVGRVMETGTETSPGSAWTKVPNDWGGNPNDDLTWFSKSWHRIAQLGAEIDTLREELQEIQAGE
jgi:hypothetical protein